MAMDGVLRLYFGESSVPTPQFIVDAAVRALAEGYTFYSENAGLPLSGAHLQTTTFDSTASPSTRSGRSWSPPPDCWHCTSRFARRSIRGTRP